MVHWCEMQQFEKSCLGDFTCLGGSTPSLIGRCCVSGKDSLVGVNWYQDDQIGWGGGIDVSVVFI